MIADGTHVRALGGLPSSLNDSTLAPFFGPAGLRLEDWVGSSAYEDADQPTPSDTDRAAALKDAEAYLVLYFAAPRINMVIADSGIVTFKVDGTSTDQFPYLKPRDLETLRQGWLRDAVSACGRYIIKAGVIIGVSPAVDEET